MIICLGTTPALQRTMIFSSLAMDAVNRAIDVRESASGKGTNVARVLREIGAEHLATGFLGGDRGQRMRQDMDRSGIRHAFVEVPAETRMCVTLIDRTDKTATELIEEPGRVEPASWERLLADIDAMLWRASAVVLSGSLAPGGSPDFYARVVQLASKARVPAIVDAKGEELRLTLAHRPLVIKPNRDELAAAFSQKIDSESTLRNAMRWATEQGAQWVIVTLGKDGARVTDGRRFWALHAPSVPVVSTIGCGDAFAAGLAVALTRGQGVIDACPLAAACAAANALTEVAGVLHRPDVERLISLAKVVEA